MKPEGEGGLGFRPEGEGALDSEISMFLINNASKRMMVVAESRVSITPKS